MAKKPMPVALTGTITHFQGLGRSLGYPTANISTATDLDDGVYFGFSDLLDFHMHPSLIFIGTPTTVGATERRVEAHLLDIPDKDYYSKPITMTIVNYHRANETFKNVKELKRKMKEDEIIARQWFDKTGPHL